jgi:protein subunit release factor A
MTHMLEVELPGGGPIHLQTEDEVERWRNLSERYRKDYRLSKVNDLTMLDTLLIQQITLFRAQRALSGMEPEFRPDPIAEVEVPTGQYVKRELKPAERRELQDSITTASKEIREIEKAMGIDKKSRDQQGNETVPEYIARLKAIGHEYGIHVANRVKAYEEFAMNMRWRVRLEEQGDAEDKAHHECTPEGIVTWARRELEKLEEIDRRFAHEKGKLAVGRV